MKVANRAQRVLVPLACSVLMACVPERWKPATSLPTQWGQGNPCEDLQPVRNVRPRFPEAARATGEQGWVALKYNVAANGDVFNVRVVASSPQGVFDEASAATLAQRRYAPSTYPMSNCTYVFVYSTQPGQGPTPQEGAASFAAFEEVPAR